MPRLSAILIAASLLASNALAGGSFEPVIVKSLNLKSATDYELVIQPTHSSAQSYKDPYFGSCSLFTVRGTYSLIQSTFLFPEFVTRKSHVAALERLTTALKTSSPINFGWIGTGFKSVDPKIPCLVRSRALYLSIDPNVTAILSFHDGI